jgi:hypothetical protein
MKRQHCCSRRSLARAGGGRRAAVPAPVQAVTEELPLPPTGEAAYNPLYALKLALLAHGQKVSAGPNLRRANTRSGRATRCCCTSARKR